MILASAVCPDTVVTRQRSERCAVLDATEIGDAILDAADVGLPLSCVFEPPGGDQRLGNANDESARAADPGGGRQVTGEHYA